MLAIGAALLGAESVVGIEIDEKALETARANADLLEVEMEFIAADANDPLLPDKWAPAIP